MNRLTVLTVVMLASIFGSAKPVCAGAVPVADVTVSVNVTPAVFQPLSTGVIELTMRNNGPEAAGTDYPGSYGNLISQRAFLLSQPSQSPPYRVLSGTTGCAVVGEIFGPNVNMLWGFVWSFYYPAIPAGESRTCRIPIEFGPAPFETFETSWRISTNPEDPDLTNNVVAYTFVAGLALVPPIPVPLFDRWSALLATLCLLVLALSGIEKQKRMSWREPAKRNSGDRPE